MQFKKATKIALQLFAVTVFTKLIGFIREVAFGARFGTSIKADAFPLALQLPNILFASVFAAFSTSFIPFYTEIREKKGGDEGVRFTNSVINTLLLASSVVAILGFIFSKQLILLQVHASKSEQIFYASRLLKITIFMILFTSSANILQGFLQANGNFIKPVLSSIPFNLAIFVAIFLSYFGYFKKIDIYIVAVGFVFGYFLSLVYQLYNAKKYGFKFYPVVGLKDRNIINMIKFSFPVFISSSMAQVYTFIDRYLLTGTSSGAVAAVAYAGKLNDMVVGVFLFIYLGFSIFNTFKPSSKG
ncbi:lipid II flippase MurJ [Caldicellulosiruptor sp. DIB 104C]|uniref:lipid II flippase MurJ n=1 Tax=Caldicellulosiruptor sp. DIB 104C TaxID=3019889 RepID=UPI002306002C|nr:lipid II flippase MurJ [Caldicellulosiruptor sp. DIB 104C]